MPLCEGHDDVSTLLEILLEIIKENAEFLVRELFQPFLRFYIINIAITLLVILYLVSTLLEILPPCDAPSFESVYRLYCFNPS